jgi:hypothetical protein
MDWVKFFAKAASQAYKQWNRDLAHTQKDREKEWRRAERVRQEQAHLAVRVSLDREISQLSDVEFEAFVATLFENEGWQTSLTARGADMGIDIEMHRPDDGKRAIVQCKKWKGNVGQPVVRDLYGAMHHMSADAGYIVSSSEFTRAAISFAQGKPVHLIGGAELLEWVNRCKARQQPVSSGGPALAESSVEHPQGGGLAGNPEAEKAVAGSPEEGTFSLLGSSAAYLRLMVQGCEDVRKVLRYVCAQRRAQQSGIILPDEQHSLARAHVARRLQRPLEVLETATTTFDASWNRGLALCSDLTPAGEARSHFEEILRSLRLLVASFQELTSIDTTDLFAREMVRGIRDCYIALCQDLDRFFGHVEEATRLFLESPQSALSKGVARRLPNGEIRFAGFTFDFPSWRDEVAKLNRLLASRSPGTGTGCLVALASVLALAAALGIVLATIR